MTPLQYALLGLLARSPMSGYDVTKLFEHNLGNIWTARHSQIYPDLARLQEEGLIAQTETGPRGRKTYKTTEAGLAEVRRWLREARPEQSQQNTGLIPIFLLWLVEKSEARDYLARERVYHRAQVERLRQAKEWIGATAWSESPPAQSMGIVLEAMLRYETTMTDWAEWAITRFSDDSPKDSPTTSDAKPEEG